MARRRRSRFFPLQGTHRLRGRIVKKRRVFNLRRHSPYKRKLRGYRINPLLGLYGANPRRRRGHRRSYRSNPAVASFRLDRAVRNPAVLIPAAVSAMSAVGVLTAGNWLSAKLPDAIRPGTFTSPYINTLARAAVRGGVAWGTYRYLPLGKYRAPFAWGAGIAIVGSALLDFMGKTLMLGANDGGQLPSAFVDLPGIGAGTSGYIQNRMLRGANGYIPRGLASGVGRPVGAPGVGNRAASRIYGGAAPGI